MFHGLRAFSSILGLLLLLFPPQANPRQQLPFGFFRASVGGGCSGALSNGYCWYRGNGGESCDTVCAGHGGCDSGGVTWANTSGNCDTILSILVPGSTAIFSFGPGTGCGTVELPGLFGNNGASATCSGTYGTYNNRRICSCAN